MDQRSRFFIYNRKEMGVLVLLAVLVSVFAFTLGVHLGKRVGPKGVNPAPSPAATVGTVEDEVPNAQEFTENAAKVHEAADESLDQAAKDEVVRTGIKLDTPRQIELPRKAKTHNAGATSEAPRIAPAPIKQAPAEDHDEISVPAAQRPTPAGKYTLQIGSYPKLEEAVNQVNSLEAAGLKPYLRIAEVKGVGKRYRLYVGGFASRDLAQKAGKEYQSQQLVDAFVVANTP